MSVLVTGSTGYVGANLFRHLFAAGCDRGPVVGLFRDPRKAGLLREALGRPSDAVFMVQADLAGPATALKDSLDQAFTALRGGLVVVHCAALRGHACEADPALAVRTNIEATRRLVEAARRWGCVRRFIYVSSQSVYGAGSRGPWTEDSPIHPTSAYGLTKYAGEITADSLRESGVEVWILRSARIYGAGLFISDEGLLGAFSRAIGAGQPLLVHGSGKQRISLVHIDDLCRLLVTLALPDGPGGSGEPRGVGGVYNVCGHSGITVAELADMFLVAGARLGIPSPGKQHVAAGRAAAVDYWLDGSRIQRDLGWAASVSLECGISGLLRIPRGTSP